MALILIEIGCPVCDHRLSFWVETRTNKINDDERACGCCGTKLMATLEFEVV